MNVVPNKKDIPSLVLLLALLAVLVFIYAKPQIISSNLSSQDNIEHIIHSKKYELSLSEKEKQWLKNNQILKLGIDRDFPPFGFISTENEYQGFSADLLRIIEHRLKIKFDIKKQANWDETVKMAKAGELDVVSTLVNTKANQQFLNFSKTYMSNPTVIISDAINKGYIASLDNLRGKKVAIEKGSYMYGELKRLYPDITLMPVKNTNLALSLVASEMADAYVGNAVTASYLIKKFGYQNLSFAGETEYSNDHSIGVNKENKILLSIINKALDSVTKQSRKALTDHWFGMQVKESISPKTIVKIATSFLFLMLILLSWGLSLRKTKNELKLSQALIKREAEQDHLTGLGNRRRFYYLLEKEINSAQKFKQSFALFLLDFDNFKEINDSFGHSVGDLVIIEAAKRIQDCLTDNDKITRLSGDEFMLIISDVKRKNKLESYVKQIQASLSNTFYIDDNEINTSASIGITRYPYDATNSEQLVINVDQAMFHSKKMGSNRFAYFNRSLKNEIITRNNTIKDLRNALQNNDEFELHYQPIIDLTSNKIIKAEALIRWNHPERGLIYPDTFIPIAEETGLIIDLGEWIFKKAVSETVKFKQIADADFQMSINTSPLQYGKKGMNVSDWFSHIITSGLSGKDITLEITEGILMESSDSVKNKLYNLRDLDIKISIDDFGTGYSSLSYLKKFDIDFLKIDRSFVQNLCTDPDDLVLIQTIIIMAHKLGCKVIAEGIENDIQREILIQEGCDYGQGYHFSKPLNSEAFTQLLTHWNTEKKEKTSQQVVPFNKVSNNKIAVKP